MWKMSIQYPVPRFEPMTFEHESPPITTRPGRPTNFVLPTVTLNREHSPLEEESLYDCFLVLLYWSQQTKNMLLFVWAETTESKPAVQWYFPLWWVFSALRIPIGCFRINWHSFFNPPSTLVTFTGIIGDRCYYKQVPQSAEMFMI